ncbi:crystallin beta/gamma motif-containing protein, partial [uncultured Caudovirales phage]
KSDTEQTVVAELDRALTPEEGYAVAAALGQEAVAQHTGNKQGALYGPNAAAWGDFTPEFYLNMDGSRLAEPAAPNEVSQGPAPVNDRAVRKMLENLTPRERSKVGNSLAKKILDHLTNLPSANEFAAVAYAGRAKRGWYSESAETISAIFGPDAPRFAMLLAALSPQVSVETNLGNALRIWKAWTSEGRPQDDATILRIMGENVEGDKGVDSVLEAWRNNTFRALGYEDLNDITLSGPKVNSFYLNLIGDVMEVTNDTWMARFAAVDQTLFKGGLNPRTDDPGKGSGYLAFNARVREAAKVLTKLTGETWTPAEVQETVWTWAQGLMELANSAVETRKPSDIIKENGLAHALSHSTAGFGSLLLKDQYRSILEEAGYADELARLAETDDRDAAPEPGSDIGLEGEAGPFTESAQQRYELAAARRLDAQWAARRELYQSPGGTGEAGLAEAQGAATNLDRGGQRLDGLPDKPMLIDGQWYVPGPNAQAHDAAQAYMESAGLPYTRPRAYVRVDTVRAAKIAAEFEKMEHKPNDPEVALAYQALIDETLAQWQAIKATGLRIEFIDFEKQGDPYAESPRLAIMDVQDNNHLWVFPTDAGFGSDDTDVSGNPLFEFTDEYIDGKRLRANDVFRIVHDYFGHIKDGVGFRAEGEENAWRSHAAMFSPLARRALTTETRGQNSWVNYGPHGEKNRKASAGDTIYAPQKIGLLPQWVTDDGRMDDAVQDKDPNFPSYGTPTPGSISVLGVHFSMGERKLLSSAMYGTGAVGAERTDVMNAEDKRLKDRVYFYTPEGKGIIAERKVGGVAHGAKLNNIYDATNDPLGIWAKGGESAVIDAGFNGYYARNTNLLTGQGVTILLGKHNVPVSRLGFERDANEILKGQKRTLRQPQADGARGSLSFETDITSAPSVITLLQNADLSTFLHESGHFFLEVMSHMAAQPNAPQGVVDDMNAVLKWFGVSDLATWRSMSLEEQRDFHERFARGFEAYLFEGKSPNSNMQGLFATFARWLKSVYRELTALNVQLTDEVRGVFDRMLASEEQIKETEIVRGYTAMFKTAEEMGTTPEEWSAYQKLHAEATEVAVQELQERSLRNMGWLSRLRARTVAKLTDEANTKRRALRKEVLGEVRQQPVYAVQQFLKHGILPDGTQAVGAKLSLPALREMYGDGPAALWRYFNTGKYGMATSDVDGALTPDAVAEMFEFKSGDEMVRAILAADPESVVVDGMTDQRMLERYSDMADPAAIERAANDAVHNEARLKFVAAELKALAKANTPARALILAAKDFATNLVNRKVIKDLKPGQYTAAEGRSAKAALEALKKGDTVTAATHKRNQLVNGYAARVTTDVRKEVDKTIDFFRRVMRGNAEEVAKSRDVDVVMAARAILAQYGIGTNQGKTAREYLELVQQHDPQMYDILRDDVEQAFAIAKDYNKLTVSEFSNLRDLIESMWHLAKRSRQMEIDGDLMDREDIQGQLRERMDEIGVPDKVPGTDHAVTQAERRLAMLQTFVASLRRVEAWVGAKDGSSVLGPFRRFIWQPVKDAADRYRADKAKFLKRYRDALDAIAPTLKPSRIDAPELGYAFGFSRGGSGKAELLHAILHTGNDSNKRKLLLGRKWATDNGDGTIDTSRWDAFITRMIAEGTLTKADYDFAQSVWDLLEEMKPLAQKTHRDVFGRYFAEVSADVVVTPFGTYRGGYVPAMADAEIVTDAKTRALAEEENQTLAYAFPTTAKGFTKSRVDYNKPLLLDLRSLSQHIDKVLLFSHLEQPIRDVRRILTSKEVNYALNRIDPAASDSLLTPWLNRTARQQVETPIVGANGLMRFFSVARSRAGMSAMFANVSNTVQQITGFSMASLKVPPKYLMSAIADYAMSPKAMTQAVAENSNYMATRMDQEVAQLNDAVNDILLNPNVYEKATAWTAKHAYFLQSAVDNVMGPIIWTGAYNHAIEEGQTPADAKRLADSAVRETQGSTLPEDVSRIETGNAFVRLFTQFAGYFNMQANLLGTEFQRSIGELGLKQGAGRGLYVFLFGFLVPAWTAEAIALMFKGGPGDDDKDGDYLDDWLKSIFLFGTLRNATAMIPAVGPVINAAVNATNTKPYDDRISTSPAISMIESAVRSPVSVYEAVVKDGKASKAVRDVATLTSLTLGLPATAIARPIAYGLDLQQGKAQPENPVDAARGFITGAAGK